MSTVLLLILLIVSIIMTGLILIQRSEGGALGIGGGGGGGGGGFMSGRTAANSVSRMTGYLGAVFLVCCLLLSVVFNRENQTTSILDVDEAEISVPVGDDLLTAPADSGDTIDPLGDAQTPVVPQNTDANEPDASDEEREPNPQ